MINIRAFWIKCNPKMKEIHKLLGIHEDETRIVYPGKEPFDKTGDSVAEAATKTLNNLDLMLEKLRVK